MQSSNLFKQNEWSEKRQKKKKKKKKEKSNCNRSIALDGSVVKPLGVFSLLLPSSLPPKADQNIHKLQSSIDSAAIKDGDHETKQIRYRSGFIEMTVEKRPFFSFQYN